MSDPEANAMLVVGKITGCYGIKGWVKIHAYTDPQENFLGFGHWMLKRRGGLEPIEFDDGRRQGRGLVAHIAGVDDRTVAESYRGLEIAVQAVHAGSILEILVKQGEQVTTGQCLAIMTVE